ncbi:MAG: Fe-Mn family superoxide dismutase, partial [Candidatus Falkowbacteria bacterium]|nr:Fe-Mn family superoxide dismutase [Candidatus Falkowbacteria bacterium]
NTQMSEAILNLINTNFASLDDFYNELKTAAVSQFGSGWAWLIKEGDKLKIIKTANAALPDLKSSKPLLVIDVWEHAYYLDYQNRRLDYVEAIIRNLLNWDFAQANLEK